MEPDPYGTQPRKLSSILFGDTMVPIIELDYILLLGYSIVYKEYNLIGFNHQKNATQLRSSFKSSTSSQSEVLRPEPLINSETKASHCKDLVWAEAYIRETRLGLGLGFRVPNRNTLAKKGRSVVDTGLSNPKP